MKLLLIPLSFILLAGAVLTAKRERTFVGSNVVSTGYVKVKDGGVSGIPPQMERIKMCESSGRHTDKNGKVLRGKVNPHDIGLYQISEVYWLDKALSLGFDIYDEKGNEDMAVWIYTHHGAIPWKWSKKCWEKTLD